MAALPTGTEFPTKKPRIIGAEETGTGSSQIVYPDPDEDDDCDDDEEDDNFENDLVVV